MMFELLGKGWQRVYIIGEALWDWVDNRAIVRRIAFFMVMYLVFKTLEWTLDFAATSPRPGMEVAAIIAAVWAPITALQAAMFGLYSSWRGNNHPAPVAVPTPAAKPAEAQKA